MALELNEIEENSKDELLNDFRDLIFNVSKEIIEISVMTDLRKIKDQLKSTINEMPSQTKILKDSVEHLNKINKEADRIQFVITTKMNTMSESLDIILNKNFRLFEDQIDTKVSNISKVTEEMKEIHENIFRLATKEFNLVKTQLSVDIKKIEDEFTLKFKLLRNFFIINIIILLIILIRG